MMKKIAKAASLIFMLELIPAGSWALNAIEPTIPFYRVWRGFPMPGLTTPGFLDRLQPFIVDTRTWLTGHQGVAYLPVVPPAGSPANIPGELAIVAYTSQADYEKEKATPVGKQYQDSHWTLFEKPGPRSKSGGPSPYNGEIVMDTPYDAARVPVDWQSPSGQARFFLGKIKDGTSLNQLADLVSRTQREFATQGLDGHIVVADSNRFMATWQHWRSQEEAERAARSDAGQKITEVRDSLLEPLLDAPAALFDGNVRQGGVYNVRFTPQP